MRHDPFQHHKFASGISYLQRERAGKTVLLLHGIGSCAESFETLLPYLSPNFNLIAWNAPGYGTSQPFAHDFPSAKDYADRVMEWMQAIGYQEFAVIGHSLGTLIGGSLARHYPQAVSKLVLLSCAVGYGAKAGDPLPEKAQQRLDSLEKEGAAIFAQKRARNLLFNPDSNPLLLQKITKDMSQIQLPGYAHAVQMLSYGNLVEDMKTYSQELLMMVGENDTITPVGQSEAVLKSCVSHHSKLIQISQAGHALYQQQPQHVALTINSFLDSNFST